MVFRSGNEEFHLVNKLWLIPSLVCDHGQNVLPRASKAHVLVALKTSMASFSAVAVSLPRVSVVQLALIP